jgi:hypothetical protein
MSYIMVDVESDGPIPKKYSMVCFGAIVVEPTLSKTFYGRTRPISEGWDPAALAISGVSREQHLSFDDPRVVMEDFEAWIAKNCVGKPRFVSDNNGYDWQWINFYFHWYLGRNPFGFSSTNLGSLYKGLVKSDFKNFKHLRRTEHTHNPVDDARGNAEAMLHMKEKMGLEITLE